MKEFLFEVVFQGVGSNQLIRSSGYNVNQAWNNIKQMYPNAITYRNPKEV
ncbi:Uncharacterised protein [Escherichia coli]|uniref:Uncharacterized protein n=3 Tax=Asteriusvirus PBECO4 TaxID=2560463 RepID=A0A5A4U561_9CAUD|nr:hypothetical protein [Escherichia coli]YP_009150562.1 hypothetical protein ACQ29_gp248 [Escherichia phage PBECO4]AXC37031.1 hypothetical protein [Escherichia phage UB]MED6536237.1 hypothetical protein [Escherichia coli O157]QBO61516.1 hypothetical protein G17_00020 [Escherichia phage vB_EcoM_G17]QXN76018.1 hypothetical protein [Escherichia phage BF17]WGM49277.1 hypothetical protein EcMJ_034 [Escherichia phage vB_Ec-M-J]WNN14359.1 hypothetical protein Sharanji_gp071 [Escherichia phage Shar